jgi:hypothetical protein
MNGDLRHEADQAVQADRLAENRSRSERPITTDEISLMRRANTANDNRELFDE